MKTHNLFQYRCFTLGTFFVFVAFIALSPCLQGDTETAKTDSEVSKRSRTGGYSSTYTPKHYDIIDAAERRLKSFSEKLGFSEVQKQDARKIFIEHEEQTQKLPDRVSMDPKERKAILHALDKETLGRIHNLLSPQQQELLAKHPFRNKGEILSAGELVDMRFQRRTKEINMAKEQREIASIKARVDELQGRLKLKDDQRRAIDAIIAEERQIALRTRKIAALNHDSSLQIKQSNEAVRTRIAVMLSDVGRGDASAMTMAHQEILEKLEIFESKTYYEHASPREAKEVGGRIASLARQLGLDVEQQRAIGDIYARERMLIRDIQGLSEGSALEKKRAMDLARETSKNAIKTILNAEQEVKFNELKDEGGIPVVSRKSMGGQKSGKKTNALQSVENFTGVRLREII